MKKGTLTVNWSHEAYLNSEFTFVNLTDEEKHKRISFVIAKDDATREVYSLTAYGEDFNKTGYKESQVYKDHFEGSINDSNLCEAIHWIVYHTIESYDCVRWFSRDDITELKYKTVRELSDILYFNQLYHETKS